MIKKIISGGQTGVDRAALDVAINLKINWGGWCPRGRIDENGTIPQRYTQLVEIPDDIKNEKENYDTRTKMNIRDSDASLIIVPSIPIPNEIQDGTRLTIQYAVKQNARYLILNLNSEIEHNLLTLMDWIKANKIQVLNVAGPRESLCPGIYINSYNFLIKFMGIYF
ncbi:MAG: putative molybdenum carrier protein [Legionella sp.]|nr:putative molybdenum carrier protein [Legionella sp.]